MTIRFPTSHSEPHRKRPFLVLGIETSCDETAAAIVSSDAKIMGQELYSQILIHKQYGGVVPEVSARKHLLTLPQAITELFEKSNLTISDIDAIAVTAGPGLIGGLIVGISVAKGIALAAGKPCLPINHLMGHALAARLEHEADFPYLLLLISGGHCQLVVVSSPLQYSILGETLDDSVGEAFDKFARMLGLGYPGGAMVESLARSGNPLAIDFPKPFYKQKNCSFSFSGLKTSAKRYIDRHRENMRVEDVCASFQHAIALILADRLMQAILCITSKSQIMPKSVVVSGGVASNMYILSTLRKAAHKYGLGLLHPRSNLCTDNAVMIAWAGIELINENPKHHLNPGTHDLSFAPKSRWPLNKLMDDYEVLKKRGESRKN